MSENVYRRRPVGEGAMEAARELGELSEDTRWRDLGDGTIEVVRTKGHRIERHLVLNDGTSTLVESAPRGRADRWSLRVGCLGPILAALVGSALVVWLFGEDWAWVWLPLALGVFLIGNHLAHRSQADVARYLDRREGGDAGWQRL
jgi:hypothetical protein